ncbi:MAG: phospholipase [Pirellulales bacterium]|nr:phospholipase [Pirellulales bacterium]
MFSSQTNAATESLRTLHRILRDLSDYRSRLRRGPNVVAAHDANVARREAELNDVRETAKKAKMASDAKQGQLRDGEEKVKKIQGQLNAAGSNREYQALKDQIAAVEMANSVLADEILEGLEKLDEFTTKIGETEQVVAKAQAERDRVKKEVNDETPKTQAKIEELEGQLKEAEAGMPEDFIAIYRRAVAAKREDALAPVRGEYCGGCNQKVPLNAINCVLLPEPKPLVCRSCGRMLYVPEDWSQS